MGMNKSDFCCFSVGKTFFHEKTKVVKTPPNSGSFFFIPASIDREASEHEEMEKRATERNGCKEHEEEPEWVSKERKKRKAEFEAWIKRETKYLKWSTRARESMRVFEADPTYANYLEMHTATEGGDSWCGDTLCNKACEIPLEELKKILKHCDAHPAYHDDIELIVKGHDASWTGMDKERMALLHPRLDETFWDCMAEDDDLRNPNTLSFEEFETVVRILMK
jgi:hypothetical protein